MKKDLEKYRQRTKLWVLTTMNAPSFSFEDGLALARNTIVVLSNTGNGLNSITTQGGDTFRVGDKFKVLGYFASVIRLSRIGDNAKLATTPSHLCSYDAWVAHLKATIKSNLKVA